MPRALVDDSTSQWIGDIRGRRGAVGGCLEVEGRRSGIRIYSSSWKVWKSFDHRAQQLRPTAKEWMGKHGS
eukprot:817383-Pyramimonas_sp.AAC.2